MRFMVIVNVNINYLRAMSLVFLYEVVWKWFKSTARTVKHKVLNFYFKPTAHTIKYMVFNFCFGVSPTLIVDGLFKRLIRVRKSLNRTS